MDDCEIRSELFQNGYSRRLIVDEDATFAAGNNLAAQNDLAIFAVDAILLEDTIDPRRAGFEDRRNCGLVCSVANRVAGSFVAQQQGQRVDEDGFSGAGFAGQQVEAGSELHGDVVDDRVVFDPQFQQHVSSRTGEVRGSVAGKLPAVSYELPCRSSLFAFCQRA